MPRLSFVAGAEPSAGAVLVSAIANHHATDREVARTGRAEVARWGWAWQRVDATDFGEADRRRPASGS